MCGITPKHAFAHDDRLMHTQSACVVLCMAAHILWRIRVPLGSGRHMDCLSLAGQPDNGGRLEALMRVYVFTNQVASVGCEVPL